MSLILVEREFDEPQVFAELQAVEDAHAWCLEMYEVTFSHTYFSADRRHMVCAYRAADAESVRLAQRKAGMPFSRAWAAAEFSIMRSRDHDPTVPIAVMQRDYPQPITAEAADKMRADAAWCMETHGVGLVSTYVEAGGTRGLCVYVAPDLEAVRRAGRMANLPPGALWAGTLILPPS